MAAVYITSSEKGSGKTAICAGLATSLAAQGKKVGYFKPLISGTDADADFMIDLLGLKVSAETVSPPLSSTNLARGARETFRKASEGRDVVVIEGAPDQYKSAPEIAKTLNAKVIVIAAYSKNLSATVSSSANFGDLLLGVILNKVPANRLEQARSLAAAALEKTGGKLLGIIPEDRGLFAMTVGEIAGSVKGEITRGAERSTDLVESLMLGALAVDTGPSYFGRKDNKAVVLKSERPDLQLAALETSTRCLVLTGNAPLNDQVLARAEEKDTTIIRTASDVTTAANSIEKTLVGTRFHQAAKVARVTELLEQNLDLPALIKAIG